jgi:hypothetical protein
VRGPAVTTILTGQCGGRERRVQTILDPIRPESGNPGAELHGEGATGDLEHRIGLPAKSGIGGGILAIAPGRGAVCAWGPGLDRSGNSIAAIEALDHFTSISGWSVF